MAQTVRLATMDAKGVESRGFRKCAMLDLKTSHKRLTDYV